MSEDNMKTPKPPYMEEPRILHADLSQTMMCHGYDIPDKAAHIIEAIQWMIEVYDDVKIECDSRYLEGSCTSYLVGYVRPLVVMKTNAAS